MADFFISHASQDGDVAKQIVAALEAEGATCWFAPRDVRAGADYQSEILRGLKEATGVILLYSSRAGESRHVARELGIADTEGLPIYPLRLEDTPLQGPVKYVLANRQWIDFFADPDAAIANLLKSSPNRGTGSVAKRAWRLPLRARKVPVWRFAAGAAILLVIAAAGLAGWRVYEAKRLAERCLAASGDWTMADPYTALPLCGLALQRNPQNWQILEQVTRYLTESGSPAAAAAEKRLGDAPPPGASRAYAHAVSAALAGLRAAPQDVTRATPEEVRRLGEALGAAAAAMSSVELFSISALGEATAEERQAAHRKAVRAAGPGYAALRREVTRRAEALGAFEIMARKMDRPASDDADVIAKWEAEQALWTSLAARTEKLDDALADEAVKALINESGALMDSRAVLEAGLASHLSRALISAASAKGDLLAATELRSSRWAAPIEGALRPFPLPLETRTEDELLAIRAERGDPNALYSLAVTRYRENIAKPEEERETNLAQITRTSLLELAQKGHRPSMIAFAQLSLMSGGDLVEAQTWLDRATGHGADDGPARKALGLPPEDRQ